MHSAGSNRVGPRVWGEVDLKMEDPVPHALAVWWLRAGDAGEDDEDGEDVDITVVKQLSGRGLAEVTASFDYKGGSSGGRRCSRGGARRSDGEGKGRAPNPWGGSS